MASTRLEDLFEQVREATSSYSTQANELSNAILKFEKLLNKLPVQAQIEASSDEPEPLKLRYSRDGDTWRLQIPTFDPPHPMAAIFNEGRARVPKEYWTSLSDASLEKKINAIRLFEDLLNKLLELHKSRKASIENALAQLNPLLAKLHFSESEDD